MPAQKFPAEPKPDGCAPHPAHIHQIGAGEPLRDVQRWFLAYSSPSRSPNPHHLAVLARPGFVRAAPTHPGTSRDRLPPATTDLLRQDGGEGLSPPLNSSAPHGARGSGLRAHPVRCPTRPRPANHLHRARPARDHTHRPAGREAAGQTGRPALRMSAVWRCRVCGGVNRGERVCSTCGAVVPRGEPLRAAVRTVAPNTPPTHRAGIPQPQPS